MKKTLVALIFGFSAGFTVMVLYTKAGLPDTDTNSIKLLIGFIITMLIINFKNSFRKQENSRLIIDELYRMFIEQSIINFENENLEQRYDDFSLLMDEYHDGILLYDLMNEKVWSTYKRGID